MIAELLAAAFMAGISLAALAGNFLQWRLQTAARLSAPVVDPNRPIASIIGVSVAGPFLLVNEAIILHHADGQGRTTICLATVFAALWCLASGIICLELTWQIRQFL